MWRLSLYAMFVTGVWVTAARLRCVHRHCVDNRTSEFDDRFWVEDHEIEIHYYENIARMIVNCNDSPVLDSPALPGFPSVVQLTDVELSSCPLPSEGSFANVLAALNVTLLQDDGSFGNLALVMLPPEPPLTARHFAGLERITGLDIYKEADDPISLTASFLTGLKSLRSLEFTNVLFAATELDDPPPGLRSLKLTNTGIERLPEVLLALPNLQTLEVTSETTGITAMFKSPPPSLNKLQLHSTNTTLQLGGLPAVEEMSLLKWTERRPAPMTQCNALLILDLENCAAEELPERWVAACPLLDDLKLQSMLKLVSLPPKLLDGASELVTLHITDGVLETLPERLLEGAPNLLNLILNNNRLHTIPSDAFLGPRGLSDIELNNNQLERSAVAALAPLAELSSLSLSDNPGLGDLCDHNGYSPLVNLTKLLSLHLSGTNITRICRDWRENLTHLFMLDLKDTQISELQYTDYEYKRDASAGGTYVHLEGAPIKSVRFTEDDYKRSLTAPASVTWVHIDSSLDCDCRMYWTRLVAERAKESPYMPRVSFLCTGDRTLSEETADNICATTNSASISNYFTLFPPDFPSFYNGYLILALVWLIA